MSLFLSYFFCHTNQKNLLQKERKDWIFEVYFLIGKLSQFLVPADWIMENDFFQILCMVLEVCVKQRGFGLFFATLSIGQTQWMNVICPKSVKINEKVQFWFVQKEQNDYQFWTTQRH